MDCTFRRSSRFLGRRLLSYLNLSMVATPRSSLGRVTYAPGVDMKIDSHFPFRHFRLASALRRSLVHNKRTKYLRFSSLSWYEKTHIHHHFADISHSVLDSAVCYSGQNFSLCFDSDSDPFTYSLPRETPQAWLVAALPSRVAATVLLCDATSNHKLLRRVQTFPVPSRFCVMVARPTKPQHTSPFAERISACIHKPRRHISDNALLCLNFLSVRYLLYGVIVATLLRWFTKTFKPNMTLFGTSYALYRQTFLSRNARHPNDPSEIKCRHELWIQTQRRWGRVR